MKCAGCGKEATKYNKDKVPVCSGCVGKKVRAPKCPECGLDMAIRKGKYGSFWGCPAFPMCNGIQKI